MIYPLVDELDHDLSAVDNLLLYIYLHTSTFQLLDKPWSQVSSLLPPGSCLPFLSHRVQHFHSSSIFH